MQPVAKIKSSLEAIGYKAAWFSGSAEDMTDGEIPRVALVAHSRLPKDLRTAAIAVYQGDLAADSYPAIRTSGAAIAISGSASGWRMAMVAGEGLKPLGRGGMQDLDRYLAERSAHLNPDAIYRAKVWGRLEPESRQTDFVDAGLMPLVEQETGVRVSGLLEGCVRELADTLGWTRLDDSRADDRKAEWLIKAPFWLLAAKILRDKRVRDFVRIDLNDFQTVFSKLAKHYRHDDTPAVEVPAGRRRALGAVAERIGRFASLELLSAEALGHIYESTLINKATRRKLGTHSTPPWLIDFIVARLKPWIAEMPPEGRTVFEPACGHAGFLVAALRLLDELRPEDFPEARNRYLRNRLHGVDIDPFSREIARLALTLADVPNPNGWNLEEGDIFAGPAIATRTPQADIILMNPPFESFGAGKPRDWLPNKAAEALRRVVFHMKPGAVLGFVGPQGILQSKQGREIRRELLTRHEIREVVLFADKVFEFGAPESAVILARKRAGNKRPAAVSIPFFRVRENEVAAFSVTQRAGAPESAAADDLLDDSDCPLFAPQLNEVWRFMRHSGMARAGDLMEMGQGLTHKGDGEFIRESTKPFRGGMAGFAGWNESQLTHGLPDLAFINTNPEFFRREIMGLDPHPHLLLNYAPVSRGPWRLKALVDEQGRPVTSRFIVVKSRSKNTPLEALWALWNSPLANAFAYCHLSKRDNLVGTLRELPIPDPARNSYKPLAAAASAYLRAARAWSEAMGGIGDAMDLFAHAKGKSRRGASPTPEDLRILYLRVDAEVMKLYGLPPEMERRILDLFAGEPRKGVPFSQSGYYPEHFDGLLTVSDLLAVTADWEPLAERKSVLIRKKAAGKASAAELKEFAELKRLSAGRLDLFAPLPLAAAEAACRDAERRASYFTPA